jgi:hypothetical protein
MTHTGKIGRLSKDRRYELAQRIEDGQPGTEIVNWLNAQPDVREILDAQFAGRPISEQNLSDWKQSGHLEWLRRQEAREAALNLVERADDLDETTQNRDLSDRFATVLASEMTRLAAALLEQETDPEKRWQRLCQIHRELSQLRRDDHRAAHIAIQRERWDLDVAREHHEEAQRQKAANKELMIDMLLEGKYKKENADLLYGGGESGRKKAEMLYRIKCDLPMDDLLDGTWQEPGTACPRKPAPAPHRSGVSAERRQPTCPKNVAPAKAKPAAKQFRKPKPNTMPAAGAAKTPADPQKSSLIKAIPPKILQSDLRPPSSVRCPNESAQIRPNPAIENKSMNPPTPQQDGTAACLAVDAGRRQVSRPGSIHENKSTNPPIQNPAAAPEPAPLTPGTPNPDPETEAYNRWFRMKCGAEPFDPEALQRLYAVIPPKET